MSAFCVFGAVLLHEQSAEACSPIVEPTLLGPDPDGPIPANAAIRIRAFSSDLSEYVASVDGEIAALTEVEDLRINHYATSTFAISIAGVTPGAHVRLRWCTEVNGCMDVIEYDASEPVLDPPPPPASLIFDLHDFPGVYGFGPACELQEELKWWIKTEVDPSEQDIEVFHLFEGFSVEAQPELRFRSHALATGDVIDWPVPGYQFQLGDAEPPEAICIRATAIDAAGNRSEPVESCLPCRYSVAPPESSSWASELPPEPAWTEADIYPSGSCADGVPPVWEPEAGGETGDDPGSVDDTGTGGDEDTGAAGNADTSASTDDGGEADDDGTGGAPATPTPDDGSGQCQVSGRRHGNAIWSVLVVVAIGFMRRRRPARRQFGSTA